MRRMRFFAISTMAALSLLAIPAAAQEDYPPDGETVAVSDPTPAPGQSVTVTASNFTPGETVTFTLDGTVLGSDVADASGTASITFNAPTTPGSYVISAGATSGASATTTITVVAAAADGDDGAGLPFTGSDIGDLVVPGAAAIGAGALLVAVASSRRRRQRAMPAS